MIRTRLSAIAARLPGHASRHSLGLFAEYDAAICRAQTPEARAWRGAQGWPRSAVLMGLGGGLARIAFAGNGGYEPCDREGVGTPAVIIPAWPGPAPGQPDELLDLVAWVPSTGALFTRCGLVDVISEEAIRASEPIGGDGGRPLRIFSSPAAWAAAATWDGPDSHGAHGVLVVRWDGVRAALGPLACTVPLVTDSVDTGRRLRAALEPPVTPRPSILVDEGRAAA